MSIYVSNNRSKYPDRDGYLGIVTNMMLDTPAGNNLKLRPNMT